MTAFNRNTDRPVFFHSEIDDAGLTPAVIRVYCHIARRDGVEGAWASIDAMARTCRIRPETVRIALKKLHALGMIRREDRPGFTSVYRITVLSEWKIPLAKEAPSTETQGVRNSGGVSSPDSQPHPLRLEVAHPLRNNGDEGNPLKEIQESNPKKDIQSRPNTEIIISIYNAYPRKQAKKPAFVAIATALKDASADSLLAATKRFAEATAQWSDYDRQFIPQPAKWFNDGSYDDDPSTWTRVREKPAPATEAPRFSDSDFAHLAANNPKRFSDLIKNHPTLHAQADRLSLRASGAVPWQRKTHEIDHSKGF